MGNVITLCRVEVQHRDEAKLREFQRLFPFKVSQVLPRLMMHRVENADGSITTYLYLARQGHCLPTAEIGNCTRGAAAPTQFSICVPSGGP